jgi:hypothetical protein
LLQVQSNTLHDDINQSIRYARAQLHAGHQNIRTYFPDTTVAAPDINTAHTRTSLLDSAFSMQEPGSPYLPQIFAGSSLGAAAAPVIISDCLGRKVTLTAGPGLIFPT